MKRCGDRGFLGGACPKIESTATSSRDGHGYNLSCDQDATPISSGSVLMPLRTALLRPPGCRFCHGTEVAQG
jgi:hypothetical protein